MGGHVVNPSTKFEDPTAIRSWVMSSDISHRIPLTGEGRLLGGKIAGGRGRPPTNIMIPLERQLNALQLCRWQFLYNETLQQTFRPSLPKLSKIRPLLTFWSPFWGSWGRRRTLIDVSLESPCRVLVKHSWTSFSISYGWGATRQNVSKLAAFRSG